LRTFFAPYIDTEDTKALAEITEDSPRYVELVLARRANQAITESLMRLLEEHNTLIAELIDAKTELLLSQLENNKLWQELAQNALDNASLIHPRQEASKGGRCS
jgi:hypothetical protein